MWQYVVVSSSKRSNNAPRWTPNVRRNPQNGPDVGQHGPRMAENGPKKPQEGPKMAQDCPKMTQTWPKTCPR